MVDASGLPWAPPMDDCRGLDCDRDAHVADECALFEEILPFDATPATVRFARHLSAALDYNDVDWNGPEQDHHDGHPPNPMPAPAGSPYGYELRHLEAVRRRWPEAVHSFHGRGMWRQWTIAWPGTMRLSLNLAERSVLEQRCAIALWYAAPAAWFGHDGPAALVRDIDRALFAHRAPYLLWAPPAVDPTTWDGEDCYSETWRGDADHVIAFDRTEVGRAGTAFPTTADCEGPRCAMDGPIYTPCTVADCDLELGGGCVLRGPA